MKNKHYNPAFSKAFVIFDVAKEGIFLDYDEYKVMLDQFSLPYIEPLELNDGQTFDELLASFKTKYVKDGLDEGIVIKKKGEASIDSEESVRMFKMIREEREQILKDKNPKTEKNVQKLDSDVLGELKETYCTMCYINKELGKLFPESISDGYKEDVAKMGKKMVITRIMQDFSTTELAGLKNTEYSQYIKRLNDLMLKKLHDLL